jgi:DNA-binding response OmpR family regulator
MQSPKGRILCTEDDRDTRDLLTFTLEEAGYKVTCTTETLEALDLIRTENFDLCILDTWMPALSGCDLCREIRKFNATTPILFYSGAAYPHDKQRAFDSGAQAYLTKPVLPEVLVREVAWLIAKSNQ